MEVVVIHSLIKIFTVYVLCRSKKANEHIQFKSVHHLLSETMSCCR